jgi:signal transduction histidine kinase
MAAVYGAAQTLLLRGAELPPERGRELLEMIATQAARLSQITEEVLLASRLDRGDVPLEHERVDLAEVARAAAHAVDDSVEVVAPERVTAAGDADRIQQVLVNLIDNAVKYGGSDVVIRVERGDAVARVAVTDNGPGIPRAEQQLIFEKFYRGDPQLARSPGGTGLGLFISRELVQRMGGRLEVESAPGGGATFLVELPSSP